MNPVETLGLALGAGFSSGLNLYATIATLGLLQRFGVIHLAGTAYRFWRIPGFWGSRSRSTSSNFSPTKFHSSIRFGTRFIP